MRASSPIDQGASRISTKAVSRNLGRRVTGTDSERGLKHAVEEINAYIAIRDILLIQAEESTTGAKLRSVAIANELVETCLRPARSPYEAQCLLESDAVRERERCAAVKVRIAELRLLVV
jgi:hypothetical protein